MALFLPKPRQEELAQGDILDSFEFFRPLGGTYKDTVWLPAMVISHSCDFTKFKEDRKKGRQELDRFPLLVAPVASAQQIPDKGTRGHAAKDRVARYFHLPAEAPLDKEDHFVDFWFIQPAAVYELLDITRIASLTDDWQAFLQRGLDRFFSWEDRKKTLGAKP